MVKDFFIPAGFPFLKLPFSLGFFTYAPIFFNTLELKISFMASSVNGVAFLPQHLDLCSEKVYSW